MIAKGEIVGLDRSTNKVSVRIPLFENAGSGEKVILPATISYQPGNLSGYQIGDIVYVAFENEWANRPVIVGKLFTMSDADSNSSNFSYCSALEVLDSAILPDNTLVGGLSLKNLLYNIKEIESLKERVTQIEERINEQNN